MKGGASGQRQSGVYGKPERTLNSYTGRTEVVLYLANFLLYTLVYIFIGIEFQEKPILLRNCVSWNF